MNDRDYLRSLGFTVGERGRFSADMLAALAARDSDDAEFDLREEVEVNGLDPIIATTPTRPARTLYGFTAEGSKVAFVMCRQCADHMMWCECPGGVLAPSIVVKCDDALVRIG